MASTSTGPLLPISNSSSSSYQQSSLSPIPSESSATRIDKSLPPKPLNQEQNNSPSNSNASSNSNPFRSKEGKEEEEEKSRVKEDNESDSNMSFGGLIRGREEKGKGRAGSDRSYNLNAAARRVRGARGGAGGGGGGGRSSSSNEDSPPSGSIHSFPPTSSSTYSQYSSTAQSMTAALNSSPLPKSQSQSETQQPTPRHSMHSSINSITPSNPNPNFHPRPRLHSTASSSIMSTNQLGNQVRVFGTKPLGIIGKHKPREIIRVERDYSAGDGVQFWSGWVWELEGRVSPTEYQNTLNELNTILASAHNPYASCFDNCLAILTLYLSPKLIPTHYKREMNRFDKLIHRINRDLFNPIGLHLLSPQKVAFLFLEIEYY